MHEDLPEKGASSKGRSVNVANSNEYVNTSVKISFDTVI